jgi:hypothetical protein
VNTQPLDELYFQWLYSQVADPEVTDPSLTYWKLLKIFFTREAIWRVPNDDNRLEDGKALRLDFVSENKLGTVNREWTDLACSVLELMVGLARKLSFEDLAGGKPHYWFWKMVENLGLIGYSDDRPLSLKKIDNTLDRVLYREYKPSGRGGFFPLKHTQKDQRKVELWYQMSEYLLEQSE